MVFSLLAGLPIHLVKQALEQVEQDLHSILEADAEGRN
jgi:hypothetical protein